MSAIASAWGGVMAVSVPTCSLGQPTLETKGPTPALAAHDGGSEVRQATRTGTVPRVQRQVPQGGGDAEDQELIVDEHIWAHCPVSGVRLKDAAAALARAATSLHSDFRPLSLPAYKSRLKSRSEASPTFGMSPLTWA
jgi:hypothetical protein